MKSAKDQNNSMDFEIGSSNIESRSTKFAHNQFSGHSNDGRTVNMGRGPTKGNDGKCGHSGFKHEGKMPPTSALPAVPAQGSTRDNINRGTQHRGGGRKFEPSATQNFKGNADRINAGPGPRKGNSQ